MSLPSSNSCLFRFSNDFEIWTHVVGARCDLVKALEQNLKTTYRLWGALDLNKAHAAVASHRKPLMIAESWNFDTSLLACLENGVWSVNLEYLLSYAGHLLRRAFRQHRHWTYFRGPVTPWNLSKENNWETNRSKVLTSSLSCEEGLHSGKSQTLPLYGRFAKS